MTRAATRPRTKTAAAPAPEVRFAGPDEMSGMFKLLADPTRLRIILFLLEAERHVGAICEHVGHTQPAVSHHLALLRVSGVIEPRRDGKYNRYSVAAGFLPVARMARSYLA